MAKVLAFVLSILRTVPGALKNHLNLIEFVQVLLAAPLTGGVGAVLTFLVAHAAQFLVGPGDVAMVTQIVSIVSAVLGLVGMAKLKFSQGR